MHTPANCPECGANWQTGKSCTDGFHQMLFWENEYPDKSSLHHLVVLVYHLQHPSRYSAEGLAYGLQLLVDFVEEGISPEQKRKEARSEVDSGSRQWNITARVESHGAYKNPIAWSMTAQEVVEAGADGYPDSVAAWAKTSLGDLRASGNLD